MNAPVAQKIAAHSNCVCTSRVLCVCALHIAAKTTTEPCLEQRELHAASCGIFFQLLLLVRVHTKRRAARVRGALAPRLRLKLVFPADAITGPLCVCPSWMGFNNAHRSLCVCVCRHARASCLSRRVLLMNIIHTLTLIEHIHGGRSAANSKIMPR